MSILLQKYTL